MSGRHDRRRFLAWSAGLVAGAGAVAGAVAGCAGSRSGRRSSAGRASSASEDAADGAAPGAPRALALDEIQAHVLVGFPMRHQALLVATLPEPARARPWLAGYSDAVTTTAAMRSAPRNRGVALALSHSGLRALGVAQTDLDRFPDEFRRGMRAQAPLLGDFAEPGDADDAWVEVYRKESVDVLVVLAADGAGRLERMVRDHTRRMARNGVRLLHVERGEAFSAQRREHFGFRDGISQPGILGFTRNPAPGQDLVQPGEFVLGYPREQGVGGDGAAGPLAESGPDWTRNGSYLVYRRLRQDVVGFRALAERGATRLAAADDGVTADDAAAKLMGRRADGTPLARPQGPADTVDFEFEADDPDGARTPLASHIRKVYPRDAPTPTGGERDSQTHRLLRRGIPFGSELPADATERHPDADRPFPDDRGLLFLCYQTSIARQFEFVQRRWSNRPGFPREGAGHDPIIGQSPGSARWCALGADGADRLDLGRRVVVPTGGGYFLAPSKSALAMLARA